MAHLLLIIIYISFIGLGLPDALLGSAWPVMYEDFGVSVSYAGLISMIIAFGTIVSCLMSDRLIFKLGTGKVTAISVAITAIAMFGFSISGSFWMLCLWAVPYGMGAGSVDASLNNYVALHYTSRHMSWLHCMWGVGASVGPYIMGYVLSGGKSWSMGYRIIVILQIILTAILFLSLPIWKERQSKENGAQGKRTKPFTLMEIVRFPGAKEVMITFFCYSALEQVAGLWASSYLTLYKGISGEKAASFASMFFIGITVGRALNGFLTLKFSNSQLIKVGELIIASGIVAMLLPMGEIISLAGLILIGLGCAPIYPCILHSTPVYFGEEKSQALIGVQTASAYVGACLMPAVFGAIAERTNISLLPVYLLILLVLMFVMYEKMLRTVKAQTKG